MNPDPAATHKVNFGRIVRRAFFLPIGVMIVISILLAWLVDHLLLITDRVDHTDRVIAQANMCQRLILDMETGVRGYQITGTKLMLGPFNQSGTRIKYELMELNQLVDDNALELDQIRKIRTTFETWRDCAQDIVSRQQQGQDSHKIDINTKAELLMDEVENAFNDFNLNAEKLRKERIEAVNWIDNNVRNFGLAVLLSLGAIISLYVRRQLNHVRAIYEAALFTAGQKTEALRTSETSLKEAEGKLRLYADDLELTVAQRTAKLEETISELEAYSYSVSHDLRAPLRAMNGYAKIVTEDCGESLPKDAQDYLGRILASTERMDNLIQDVLTYSRVGVAQMEKQRVSLDKLMADVIQQYPSLSESAQRGEIQVDGPLPSVMAPEAALGQCLSNLLTNAVKFVPEGVNPRVRIWAESTGRDVKLWVADNGIGIPPEYHARIFGVFERIPGEHPYDGTGIGLAIVRRAMGRMGGKFGLESSPGKGSRFWLLIEGGRCDLSL